MKARTVPFVVFATILAPVAALAAAPPQVGPAVAVAARPADARVQILPVCASDGEKTFLVAWQQGKKFFEGEDPRVFAARVDAFGKPLDAVPFAFPGSGAQECPRVAFADGVFLVAWQSFDERTKTWDVLTARVKPDGTFLDKDPVAVASGPGNQCLPGVADGPGGFLVVWQDDRGGTGFELWAARVSADGRATDAAALSGAKGPLRGGTPWVARTKDAWHVVWTEPYEDTNCRHLARIDDGLKATDLGRMDMIMTFYDGYLAGGETRLLYLNGSFLRGTHVARAVLFDAATGKALANPNPESKLPPSGNMPSKSWSHQMLVRSSGHGGAGFLPPKRAGAIGDFFLVVVRGARDPKQEHTGPFGLELVRIAPNGMRIDDIERLPVLDDGNAAPVYNPAVAGLKDGLFLVCYESDGGPGQHLVMLRTVKTEMLEKASR